MELTRRSFVQGAAAVAAAGAAASLAVNAEPAVAAVDLPADAVMKPGKYFGAGYGFTPQDPVRVMVEVSEDAILSVQLIDRQHVYENALILNAAEKTLIPRIVENQSFGVDVTCGATFCSNGIEIGVRQAIGQAYVAAGFPAECAKKFDVEIPKQGGVEELEYDVVVCGLGSAGVGAAMTVADEQMAAGKPVSVIAFETAAKYGGATSCGANVFAINPPELVKSLNGGEDFADLEAVYNDWMERYYQGTPCKPEVVRAYLEQSGETVDWLVSHGYMFSKAMAGMGATSWVKGGFQYLSKSHMSAGTEAYEAAYPRFGEHNFGLSLYENTGQYFDAIMGDFQAAGGRIVLEAEASELIFDESGKKVVGLRAYDHFTGKEYLVHCKAVIMCTGGFLANPEMTKKYMKNPWYEFDVEWPIYGMRQSKGTLIENAIQNGVATYNIDMSPLTHTSVAKVEMHDYPIRYRDGKGFHVNRQNTYSLNDIPFIIGTAKTSMKVNNKGQRFNNEGVMFAFWKSGAHYWSIFGEDYISDLCKNGLAGAPGTYSTTQYGGTGGYENGVPIPQMYEIIQKGIDYGEIHKGDTPEELAEIMGWDPVAFADQVEKYRGYAETGVDEQFGKSAAQLIQTIGNNGPYYAFEMNVQPYATTAALDVDINANCLDTDGNPIEGLYACGVDSGGVIESNMYDYAMYGGVAQGWGYVSGRIAGKHAVATL